MTEHDTADRLIASARTLIALIEEAKGRFGPVYRYHVTDADLLAVTR